ncbi:MAG: RloB family protein [Acutalibacteraceae bacterium]
MSRVERNGNRRTRDKFVNRRTPKLGYYTIVTDTKETEKNYLYGLRDSIPQELQGKLVIKVAKTPTKNLIEEAIKLVSMNPQYSEPWIVFDRDQVKNFDEIITQAKEKGIRVGWSNPCIEVWFNAYFGTMPTYQDSVSCCNGFSKVFEGAVKQKYNKSDIAIYEKLNRVGNESKAIEIAQRKYDEHKRNGKDKPSEMCPCTTVHILVDTIKSKVKDAGKNV